MAIITDITKQKKGDRVNVFLDGEFFCGTDAFTAAANRIAVGKEYDEDELEAILAESEARSAFDRAMKLIAQRLRTKKEIERALRDRGYDEAAISSALARLTEYGYVDDERFCEEYVRSYSKRFGANKLRYELNKLGADGEAVEKALSKLGDLSEVAYETAKKWLRTKKQLDLRKLKAYLYSRGFDGDEISSAAAKIADEYGEEDGDDWD